MLYGDLDKRMKIYLFMDSEVTLESIASSKQIKRKMMRLTVTDLKERLLEGDIFSYFWLSTEDMWADVLTKEMSLTTLLEDDFLKNKLNLPRIFVNQVKAVGMEVQMHNIRNLTQPAV